MKVAILAALLAIAAGLFALAAAVAPAPDLPTVDEGDGILDLTNYVRHT